MAIHRSLLSHSIPTETASVSRSESLVVLWLYRSEPLRCLLISCLSLPLGVLILYGLLPLLPEDTVSRILTDHLPTIGIPPALYWLRLCWTRFPFWLLLTVAGFTRFSGGLTTAVLGYRGICDGMAMGLLGMMSAGQITASLPTAFSWLRLCGAYGIWLILGLLIRLLMSVGARKIARMELARTMDGRLEPHTKETLWRYGILCLGGLCAVLVSCGLYTAILYM